MNKIAIFLLGLILGAVPTAFASSLVFSDVSEDDWYYSAVNRLNELGIIEGYSDNTFRPSANVNRAELAVSLDRLVDTLKNNVCVDGENIYFEGDLIDRGESSCTCYEGEIQDCYGETSE